MTADELREMYLKFFEGKGHAVISGSSLIPENDPTVLFTTAGMHPLVPFLLGESHPAGRRLCDCQKCVRTGDIDCVGDVSHLTFFEMLGNWSLGEYFKEEAIMWSYEFLTSREFLGFDASRLFITVFEGNELVPIDDESKATWQKLGIPEERIFPLPMADNWWGPAGKTGPCGPDTEMFVDTGKAACGSNCKPGCSCGKYFEIWNDVFMQYNKMADGSYEARKQNNVDTGMGVERTAAMLQGKNTVFETELFGPVVEALESLSAKRMSESDETAQAFRIVVDHLRSSVFILGDHQGITPSNLGQGYVLRRLIRRAVRFAKKLGVEGGNLAKLAESVVDGYKHVYPELAANRVNIMTGLSAEEDKFEKTLSRGMAELDKVLSRLKEHNQETLSGRVAFRLYDTCGFPLEFTEEICMENGISVDKPGFDKAFEKHKEVSKQGSEKAFKGGLADASEETTKLHTATHLLHKGLQMVLGDHVQQKGSNITPERLRFDFSHPEKMTPEQVQAVEAGVNKAIQDDLVVTAEVMSLEKARNSGATALFAGKYEEQVKVYKMGDFSKEVCGGPHTERTGTLGVFKIVKEESSSAGVRRIRAILKPAG